MPTEILERQGAVDPDRLLAGDLWRTVARKGRRGKGAGLDAIRQEVDRLIG